MTVAGYGVIVSGDLWLVNPATGERKRLTQTPEPESFPAWTPDGKRITFTRGTDTFVYNIDSGTEELLRKEAVALSWSLTNRTAFVRDRALWLTDAGGHNEQKIVDADAVADITIESPRFSPDASQIAFIKSQLGLRGEVWVVDVSNGMAAAARRRPAGRKSSRCRLDRGWAGPRIFDQSGGCLLDLVRGLREIDD